MSTVSSLRVTKGTGVGDSQKFVCVEWENERDFFRVSLNQCQVPTVAAAIVTAAAELVPAPERNEFMTACVGAAEEAVDAHRRRAR